MIATIAGCSALFLLCIPGLGWPIARRLPLPPIERLGVAALAAILLVYVWSGIVFVCHLPRAAFAALPAAAVIGLAVDWRSALQVIRCPVLRGALGGWLLLSAWCLGAAMFIVVHSGGPWGGDWWEHFHRARWFLEHLPAETRFLETYAMPARPPLANLVTGAFLALTTIDYAHFQIFAVWMSTIVYIPAAALALRFGAPAVAPLTLVLMLNPMVVQNATFPWTKLTAAFGVLLALHFYLSHRETNQRLYLILAAGALATAVVAHYSAVPYVIVLALWHAWERRAELRRLAYWDAIARAALAFGLVLGSWLAWSLLTYGWHSTLLSNTSVTGAARGPGLIMKTAVNLWVTVVPHPLRATGPQLAQDSPWGYARDWFFMLYQTNLLFGLGSVGAFAVLWLLWRKRGASARGFWLAFVAGAILLGTAVHPVDRWGLAHICLQPLIILGLVVLAANWARYGRLVRSALIVGWAVDATLGLVFHFAVQNLALDRWFKPNETIFQWLSAANEGAQYNFGLKFMHAVDMLGDLRTQHAAVLIAFLAALLALAVAQAARPTPAVSVAPRPARGAEPVRVSP